VLYPGPTPPDHGSYTCLRHNTWLAEHLLAWTIGSRLISTQLHAHRFYSPVFTVLLTSWYTVCIIAEQPALARWPDRVSILIFNRIRTFNSTVS
jgi:hypothetical protein